MNVPSHLAIFAWRPACWLRVTGEDAGSFLQGQFTNDLRGLKLGLAVYGLWLNVKGKVVGDSFIMRREVENEFWIGSYYSSATAVRTRLESHVIADDVIFEDQTGDWAALTVFAPEPSALIANARKGMPANSSFVFGGRRDRTSHLEWVFPASSRDTVRAEFPNLRELTQDEIDRRRIEATIPSIPADIGLNDLPNEGGLELDAISYTKGCYLGQEVMARLKSMGQVRRRLLRVTGIVTAIPTLPAPLFAGSRQVGELRSAVRVSDDGLLGLAMLTLLHIGPDTTLSFAADGPSALRVSPGP